METLKLTREDRKYAVTQEVLMTANDHGERFKISIDVLCKIIEKYNIKLSTLRKYLSEEGYKTRLEDNQTLHILK